jgi:dethiobiotin synthetase
VSKIVFVTGTDTGVGKTVVTALLLRHLRQKGINALAMKPFCSGGRGDAELLTALQDGEVPLDEVNPFYFSKPLAPWVAVKYEKGRKQVQLQAVLKKISEQKKKCDVLLIEGSGGLLVPLGDHYTVLDLIRTLRCEVVMVAKNQLGTVNHALLTLRALQAAHIQPSAFVFTESKKIDFSCRTNLDVIRKWSNGERGLRVFRVPYLGKQAGSLRGITRAEKKIKKVLAGIWDCI